MMSESLGMTIDDHKAIIGGYTGETMATRRNCTHHFANAEVEKRREDLENKDYKNGHMSSIFKVKMTKK